MDIRRIAFAVAFGRYVAEDGVNVFRGMTEIKKSDLAKIIGEEPSDLGFKVMDKKIPRSEEAGIKV